MEKKKQTKTKKPVKKTKKVKKTVTKKEVKPKSEVKKKDEVKPKEEVRPKEENKTKEVNYLEAIGKRKTASARVRLFTKGEKDFLVNEKSFHKYFPTQELQQIAKSSLEKMKCLDRFRVSAKVKGGGLKAQAEAVRHGTARILVQFNPEFRKRLKKAGLLTRDARKRERKKPGLKRARRAPQWQKR